MRWSYTKNNICLHFDLWVLTLPQTTFGYYTYFGVFFLKQAGQISLFIKKNVRGGDLFDFLKAQVAFTPISNSAVIFNTFIYWIDVNNRLERLFNMRNGLVWLQHLITWCTGLLWWSLFFLELELLWWIRGRGMRVYHVTDTYIYFTP